MLPFNPLESWESSQDRNTTFKQIACNKRCNTPTAPLFWTCPVVRSLPQNVFVLKTYLTEICSSWYWAEDFALFIDSSLQQPDCSWIYAKKLKPCNCVKELDKPTYRGTARFWWRNLISWPCIHVTEFQTGFLHVHHKDFWQGKYHSTSSVLGWKEKSLHLAMHPWIHLIQSPTVSDIGTK